MGSLETCLRTLRACSGERSALAHLDPFRPPFARFAPFWASERHKALRAAFALGHALAMTSVACPAPVVSNLEGQLRKPAVRARRK